MHSSFVAIFLAVLAPMAVLASPQWHPHGPPPNHSMWHHGPPGPEPSATATVSAGFLPTGIVGAGSTGTGTPNKLGEKYRQGTGAAAPAASATVSLTSYD